MGQIRDSGKSPKICWYDLQDGSIEARVNASESGYHGYFFRRQGGSWQLVDTYESITVYLVLFVALCCHASNGRFTRESGHSPDMLVTGR